MAKNKMAKIKAAARSKMTQNNAAKSKRGPLPQARQSAAAGDDTEITALGL